MLDYLPSEKPCMSNETNGEIKLEVGTRHQQLSANTIEISSALAQSSEFGEGMRS